MYLETKRLRALAVGSQNPQINDYCRNRLGTVPSIKYNTQSKVNDASKTDPFQSSNITSTFIQNLQKIPSVNSLRCWLSSPLTFIISFDLRAHWSHHQNLLRREPPSNPCVGRAGGVWPCIKIIPSPHPLPSTAVDATYCMLTATMASADALQHPMAVQYLQTLLAS